MAKKNTVVTLDRETGEWIRKAVPIKTSSNSNKPSTQAVTKQEQKAKKELTESEKYLVKGDVKLFNINTRLRSGTNIRLMGLGKRLSGTYFIEKITYDFPANSPMEQTLSVRSNGIGDFFKGSQHVKELSTSS
jgi:hypothetical protein